MESDIYRYITQFENIGRWSIYQFFPLPAAKINKDTFEVYNDDFDRA
jgi:hypothetical protein